MEALCQVESVKVVTVASSRSWLEYFWAGPGVGSLTFVRSSQAFFNGGPFLLGFPCKVCFLGLFVEFWGRGNEEEASSENWLARVRNLGSKR